jgi:uncharacterized membrane protein YraQ (UPF0718 family)
VRTTSGSILGGILEPGLVQLLKAGGSLRLGGWDVSILQLVMTVVYGLLMGWIASLVYKEARSALQAASMAAAPTAMAPPVANRLRTVNLQPLISLPVSGVEAISLWVVLGVGFASGLLTGLG